MRMSAEVSMPVLHPHLGKAQKKSVTAADHLALYQYFSQTLRTL